MYVVDTTTYSVGPTPRLVVVESPRCILLQELSLSLSSTDNPHPGRMTPGACNTGGEKKITADGKNDEDAAGAGKEWNREINAVDGRLRYSKQLAATILVG